MRPAGARRRSSRRTSRRASSGALGCARARGGVAPACAYLLCGRRRRRRCNARARCVQRASRVRRLRARPASGLRAVPAASPPSIRPLPRPRRRRRPPARASSPRPTRWRSTRPARAAPSRSTASRRARARAARARAARAALHAAHALCAMCRMHKLPPAVHMRCARWLAALHAAHSGGAMRSAPCAACTSCRPPSHIRTQNLKLHVAEVGFGEEANAALARRLWAAYFAQAPQVGTGGRGATRLLLRAGAAGRMRTPAVARSSRMTLRAAHARASQFFEEVFGFHPSESPAVPLHTLRIWRNDFIAVMCDAGALTHREAGLPSLAARCCLRAARLSGSPAARALAFLAPRRAPRSDGRGLVNHLAWHSQATSDKRGPLLGNVLLLSASMNPDEARACCMCLTLCACAPGVFRLASACRAARGARAHQVPGAARRRARGVPRRTRQATPPPGLPGRREGRGLRRAAAPKA